MFRIFSAIASCFFIFCFCFSFAVAETSYLTDARQAQLQAELDQVLRDIDIQKQILTAEQQKAKTIQGDINILNAKIKEAQLKIKARQIAIEGLGKDINQKTETIKNLNGKIDDTRLSLAQLLRKTNQIDEFTLTDVVLSDQNISEFFADVDAYNSIKQSIQVTLGYIKKTKEDTETAKQTLNRKRLEEIDIKISIEAEKASIEKNEKEKSRLLSLSKEQQKAYQSDISKKQAKAAQIRSALFSLRDAQAIPFSEAYQYAIEAKNFTGIDPAFLLAVFYQESGKDSDGTFGKNTGSCYLTDTNTGSGVSVKSGNTLSKVMHPTRDVPVFLTLMSSLGYDALSTKVSCPQSIGWGGAMGPAQFIPSTWSLFSDRIKSALGISNPDPWNPRHAFMAAAIYLTDLGAEPSSYSGQKNAACRYYSGSKCSKSSSANNYGNSVMNKVKIIQSDIDDMNGV